MSEYFDNKQLFSSPKVDQYNNHMVMTNVAKPVKTKYLFIDTQFCDENPRSDNYSFTLSDRITDVKTMSVVSAEIPHSFYNISHTLGNHCFLVATDSSSAMIVLPDGQYDLTRLTIEINRQLNSFTVSSNTLTYATHSDTNTSSFTAATSYTLHFAVDKTGNFDKYHFKSKLGWLLGFRSPTYTVRGVLTSEAVINLHTLKNIYLAIDEMTQGTFESCVASLPNSRINKNIIAKICLDNHFYPYGTVMCVNIHTGLITSDTRRYTGNKVDLLKFNVQLLDDIGNPLQMNGTDFSFGLKIDYM